MPLFWADYFRGTQTFTNATEHGAYLLLIAYCWDKGSIPLDDDTQRRIAKCTTRQWALVRERVTAKFDSEGRNERCSIELAYAIEKSRTLSANAKHRYSNGSANAYTPTPTPTKKERKIEESTALSNESADSPRKRTSDKRGTRLPEDWWPDPDNFKVCCGLLGSDNAVGDAVREFQDYWTALPGQKACKLDWDKTFRNRCRAIAGRKSNGKHDEPAPRVYKTYRPPGWTEDDERRMDEEAARYAADSEGLLDEGTPILGKDRH